LILSQFWFIIDSTKSQSQYSIQRLPTNKAWPASSQTQFSDVLRASPLRRAASNTQIINQSDSSNSAASKFSLALLKVRKPSYLLATCQYACSFKDGVTLTACYRVLSL